MSMSREKRRFLIGMMGEERVRTLEGSLADLDKALKEAGVGWKNTDVTFGDFDAERLLETLAAIWQNIAVADLTPEEKHAKRLAAVAEFQRRLPAPDKEVKAFISAAAAVLLENEKELDAFGTRVRGVVDKDGARRPTAAVAMMLYPPRAHHVRSAEKGAAEDPARPYVEDLMGAGGR